MPVDFAGLVLGPAMATFGRPVIVTPLISQPQRVAYAARGIWTVESVRVALEDGGNFSSVTLKLGVRLGDFDISPAQGDLITTAASDLPLSYWQGDIKPGTINIDFIVDDQTPDGQGKADLILKRIVVPTP